MPPADRCGGLNRVWRTRAVLLGYLYPLLCNLASAIFPAPPRSSAWPFNSGSGEIVPDRGVDASASAKSHPRPGVAICGERVVAFVNRRPGKMLARRRIDEVCRKPSRILQDA
jgi:hypothetical protein